MWLWTLIIAVVIYAVYSNFPKPKKNVSGQLCLITGAGSGIGRLLSLQFAKLGCKLVLLDINQAGLDKVAQEVKNLVGKEPKTYVCDVSDKEKVKKMVEDVKREVGEVDILINNAGIVAGEFCWNLKEEQVEKVFKVNTFAPMWLVKGFVPDMLKKNSGHLVTIASASAFTGVPKLSDYAASKAACFIFHESVRLELKKEGKTGIKTTVVCPYYINTGMFDGVVSYNFLLPILDPDYVAQQIVDGVLTNTEEIVLPKAVYIGFLARALFPAEWRDPLLKLFGLDRNMDHFKGQRRV